MERGWRESSDSSSVITRMSRCFVLDIVREGLEVDLEGVFVDGGFD